MGFKDSMRRRMMEQVTPSETKIGKRAANILTTTEYELFEAVDRLVEAADDVDGEFVVERDMVDRRDEILEVVDAVAEQRFEEWWWENYGDEFIDETEAARNYTGLSKAEWRDQIETWGDLYRERAPEFAAGMTDAQLADVHVERKFGVDLATFADEVVEWTAHEHVDLVIRQNLRTSTNTVHQVAAALEESDEQPGEDVDDS